MSDSTRITIRLSRNAAERLQELVDKGDYKNLSDVVRAAIEDFLAEKFAPRNIERVNVDLPKKTVSLLLELVDSGDVEAVDLNDAIRLAVKEYVHHKVAEAAKKEIKKGIKEIAEETREEEK